MLNWPCFLTTADSHPALRCDHYNSDSLVANALKVGRLNKMRMHVLKACPDCWVGKGIKEWLWWVFGGADVIVILNRNRPQLESRGLIIIMSNWTLSTQTEIVRFMLYLLKTSKSGITKIPVDFRMSSQGFFFIRMCYMYCVKHLTFIDLGYLKIILNGLWKLTFENERGKND